MSVNFLARGRLGNAIFRYFACSILCIEFNYEYKVHEFQQINCDDKLWNQMSENFINNKKIYSNYSFNMVGYYQHDEIYKKYKEKIIQYINNNPFHYVLTDGVLAGDGNLQQFFMRDLIHTPINFQKIYKNVLHIRLEDFVTNNLYIKVERVVDLLRKNIVKDHLCIVCNKPTTCFELEYLNTIRNVLTEYSVEVVIESNDAVTDFHIMKNCELLICSLSTLSWCASLLSNDLKICYFPYYDETVNQTFKKPIDNTFYY